MATAVTPPVTSKTTTSTDPLYTQALAQAKAALAAEQAPIQAEQTASDAKYAQRQTDATDESAALSQLLKGIGPQVSGMYDQAAKTQGLLGSGFSQGLQDALKGNTDNLNSMLDKLGSPAQLDSHAQQAGDVLYGLGGYTPGQTFSREGAAYGAAADMLPGTALLGGQEQVKSLRASALTADQGFQSKLAELAGKLPGDVQKNYSNLQRLALDDAKFREQLSQDKFKDAATTAAAKLAQSKYQTSVDEFNSKMQLDYQKFARQQFQQDRQYNVSLQRLGIQQTKLQLTIAANAFKVAHGGFSQQQITKFNEQANAMANSALHGTTIATTTYDAKGNVVKSGSKSTGAGQSYFQALGGMLKKGIPVQVGLAALDRTYPAAARPTPEALQQNLGPLTPTAIKQQVQTDAGTPYVAGLAMTNPSQILEQSAPQTQHIKAYAFNSAAKQHGWGDNGNLNALDQLWTQESGWDPYAKNPSSGAAGIPQALGHGNVFSLGDWQSQVDWGLNYIKGRYGSPLAAWQHEQQYGWY